jgi:HK97 family phage portal protein
MGLFTKAVQSLARGLGLADPRLYAYFGGGETDAGETVTVDTALHLDTVWACVRLRAETIATLPLHLYRRDAKGQGIIADDHPLYRVLHDRPNIEMTAVEFWECMIGCRMLWGNGYAAIARNGRDQVIALHPLRPDCIAIRRRDDGSLEYEYTFRGQRQVFTEDEIFHLKGFSLDGMVGLSPIAQARNTLATARAAERSSGSFFRNGMRPSGYLKAPAYLTPEQREDAKSILANFKGASQTGSTPLLEGGWEWQALAIPPEEAQLLATRQFHVEQICRWYGTPPILVGHHSQTTWGSGIEQIILGWLQLSLRADLKRTEQSVGKSLLTPAEQAKLYAEFNVEGLMRADSSGRAELYSAYAQNGLRTRNELRALDNQPPLPGGDDLTVQSNLVPIEKLGEVAAPMARLNDNTEGRAPATPLAEIRQ